MITTVSKAILRDRMILLKENIEGLTKKISEYDLQINELRDKKLVLTTEKQKAQQNLADLKLDIGDV
jgi:chromosome segregation ATPase